MVRTMYRGSALLALLALAGRFCSVSAQSSDQKYVFAHHMVGNTAPYTIDDWAEDIALAQENGIDAFALNIGPDPFIREQVNNAYTAALNAGSTFKLFISLDMAVMPCGSPGDAAAVRQYVTDFANHPAQFKYEGKVFISTFAGDQCAFGQGSVAQGWKTQFVDQLTGPNSVFFVPSFFVDPNTFGTYAGVTNGQFNWNSAWPITVTTNSFDSLLQQKNAVPGKILSLVTTPLTTVISSVAQNVTTSTTVDSDDAYISNLDQINQVYMASVSPWFYTHYSPQTFDKNFIYLSDQLYPTRWNNIIEDRDRIPLVEVVTWNDYGESSYVGPIKGAQPNSQAWVDGFDHTPFLDMTKFFASWYKTGAPPAVETDKVYLYARPHTKAARARADPVGKPTNADVAQDAVFAVVLATAPGAVTLSTTSTAETVQVPAGLTQLSLPLAAGDTIGIALARGGQTVASVAPENFTFAGETETFNFNVFAAMAAAEAPAPAPNRRHRRRSQRWH